jgi:predicted DNA-binding transcriptional regulator
VNEHFPAELRQFIAQHIESLAQLEALLLMRREPGRRWAPAELARTLYISDEMVRGMFAELERRGFVARDDESYFYAASGPLDDLLGELARHYQERRVAVITEIYSNPVKKVQTFADAFRLRREDQP